MSLGEVTVDGGTLPGVLTDAERRDVPIASPGGYFWRPKAGDNVLVIKSGEGERLASGVINRQLPPDLEGGELCLSSGSAELKLTNAGEIVLCGDVRIVGSLTLNGLPIISGATF